MQLPIDLQSTANYLLKAQPSIMRLHDLGVSIMSYSVRKVRALDITCIGHVFDIKWDPNKIPGNQVLLNFKNEFLSFSPADTEFSFENMLDLDKGCAHISVFTFENTDL